MIINNQIKFKNQTSKSLYNLGDSLCSPKLYFDFYSESSFTIVGGGAYNILNILENNDPSDTILWSIGVSSKNLKNLKKIDNLNFVEWSFRDRDRLVDKNKFVPCVSCLNRSIISPPTSDKSLIFLNKNPDVSTTSKFIEDSNVLYITNDCSIDEFLKKWKQCDKVITNSYHGIYWALLTGREVMPFGYSSKFLSVFEMFDLSFPLNNLYSAKHPEVLDYLIQNTKKYHKVSNEDNYLTMFQNKNIEFANNLLKHNIKVIKK